MPVRMYTPFAFDPTYREVVLADSPVAYYRLGDAGGTAADISGNSLDGTYVNGPSTTTSLITNNEGDLAREFTAASSHYVNVPDNATLRPGNGSWTVECWALVSANQNAPFVSKRQNSSPFEQWAMGISGSSYYQFNGDKFVFLYAESANATPGLGIERSAQTFGSVFNVAGTYHCVAVADKDADDIKLYVNGVSQVITPQYDGVWPTIDNTDPVRISNNNGTAYMNGDIDEVAIYNYALSADRVLAHYNAGT